MKNLLTGIFIFLIKFCIIAQADSTALRIEAMADDDNKIFAWINAANGLANKQPHKAIDYVEKGLELSLFLDNNRGIAYCYNSMASVQYGLKKYDLAIKYYKKSIEYFQEYKSDRGYYFSKKYIGAAYEAKGDYKNAKAHFSEFLEMAEVLGADDDILYAKNGLARVAVKSKQYDEGISHYNSIISIEKNRGNTTGVIDATEQVGKVYDALNDSALAFKYYGKSFELANQIGDVERASNYYQNQSDYIGNRGGNINKEIELQQQAADFNRKKGNKEGLNNSIKNLAKLNLENENPTQAISYLQQNIQLSEELGKLEAKENALAMMTKAYEQLGDYKNAFSSYQSLIAIRDSITREKEKQLAQVQKLSGQLTERDKRIELLENNVELNKLNMSLLSESKEEEVRFQRTIIYFLSVLILVLTFAAILVSKSNKARKKANMLLELKSLRTQMNPHFLFNSLNSINSFISKNDDRSANKYLSQFSRLMRMVLENSKYDLIPLSSEIQTLELYLSLEHLRFEQKFDYHVYIDPSIEIDNVEIPPMLVQPYIENAVWHGLRYLENKGKLDVSLVKENDTVKWTIEDNGIGREKSSQLKTKNQQEGQSTGMKNIEQRLILLNEMHGSHLKVIITDLNENDATGTRVEIYLRYLINSAD